MENVNHWSYSSGKEIYRKGIDYSVAKKLGIIEKSYGKAVDIGKLIHAYLLGGEQEFVVSPFKDFRTKPAQAWRDEQTLPIISEKEFETITTVGDRVKSHKLAYELLCGKGTEQEVKLEADINGKKWIGFADALKRDKNGEIEYVADLKTTAQFDSFKRDAFKNDYDLQSAVYHIITKTGNKPFYWVIAETVAPYRVGIAVASQEFEENGYRKLQTICEMIEDFDQRNGATDKERLNFNQNESMDDLLLIGDWSN